MHVTAAVALRIVFRFCSLFVSPPNDNYNYRADARALHQVSGALLFRTLVVFQRPSFFSFKLTIACDPLFSVSPLVR